MEDPVRSQGGATVVKLPLSLPLANFLLDSLAAIHINRQEQALIHSRVDDLRTFFDAFISMMESSAIGGGSRARDESAAEQDYLQAACGRVPHIPLQ